MNVSNYSLLKMVVSSLIWAIVFTLPSVGQDYKTALNNLSLEEVEAIQAASTYAKLSDDVYRASPNAQSIPDGWKLIPNSDDRSKIPAFVVPGTKTHPGTVANSTLSVLGTERNVPENPDPIGFHARAYKNEKANTVAIVFEGTDPATLRDWEANAKQTGRIPAQYHKAVEYAAKVMKDNPGSKVVFTGHSLGGGLATYAYYKTVTEPASATLTTFNAAGLFTKTYEDAKVASKPNLTANAKSFITTAYFASGTPEQEIVSSGDSKFGAKHINPRYLPINGEVNRPRGFTPNLSSPDASGVRPGRLALHSMSYAIAAIDAVAAESPSLSRRLTVSTLPNQPQVPIATKLGQQETTTKLTDDEKRSIARGLGLAAPPKPSAPRAENSVPSSLPGGQVSSTVFRPLSSTSQPTVESADKNPKSVNSPAKTTGAAPSNSAPSAKELKKGEIATTPTPVKVFVSGTTGKTAAIEAPASPAPARPTESKGITDHIPTQTAGPSVVVKPPPSTIPFYLAFPVTAGKSPGKESPPAASRPLESKSSAVQPVIQTPASSGVNTKFETASSPPSKTGSSTTPFSAKPTTFSVKSPPDTDARKPSESKPSPIVQTGPRTTAKPLPAIQPPSQKAASPASSIKPPTTSSTSTNQSGAKPPGKK